MNGEELEKFEKHRGHITFMPLAVTLRDKFAMAALQGIIQNPAPYSNDPTDYEWSAQQAYSLADAMLKERERKEEDNAQAGMAYS